MAIAKNPVQELQKIVSDALAFQIKQEGRIATERSKAAAYIYRFSHEHTDSEINEWLEHAGGRVTAKGNKYTAVVKLAFMPFKDATGPFKALSDSQINQYSSACMHLEKFDIKPEDAEDYLVEITLVALAEKYKLAFPTEKQKNLFREPRKKFHNKFKSTALEANTLQLVVGFTDANGDFISSIVVDDVKKAEKYIKDAVREPKLPANPFKPLLTWYKNLGLDFTKKEDVRIVFTKTVTSLTANVYVANEQQRKKVELDTKFEGLADCIPAGSKELSRLQLIDLSRLSVMVKHGDKASWVLKKNAIVVTPKNMTVPELLKSIRLSRTNKKANWPNEIDVTPTKLTLSYSDPA